MITPVELIALVTLVVLVKLIALIALIALVVLVVLVVLIVEIEVSARRSTTCSPIDAGGPLRSIVTVDETLATLPPPSTLIPTLIPPIPTLIPPFVPTFTLTLLVEAIWGGMDELRPPW